VLASQVPIENFLSTFFPSKTFVMSYLNGSLFKRDGAKPKIPVAIPPVQYLKMSEALMPFQSPIEKSTYSFSCPGLKAARAAPFKVPAETPVTTSYYVSTGGRL